jgi:ankyrin repeat protein
MESFKYDPLDLDGCSFRLLQLCYGDDGPIVCYLFDANLDYDIEYEALSYTWGNSAKPYEISVNDCPMPVTMNLIQALSDLRYPDRDRIIWVDAICINQDDPKERGHQVNQMGSIYKSAEQVIVWLGRSIVDTSPLFRHMRQLEKLATGHAYHEWKVSDQRWQELWSTTKPMADVESSEWLLQQRCGLEAIFNEPWFTRVWIIQEIANARSATITCGKATVSSRIFAAMPSLVGMKLDPHRQAILDIMPGPLRKHSWWAKNRELRTLLLKFRWSKSSDPTDAIYALLGISSDACDSRCLFPNYELSEEEVVRNAMAFLLSFRDPEFPAPSLPQCKLPEFMENLDFVGVKLLPWAVETGNVVLASHLLNPHGPGKERQEVDGEKLLHSALQNGHAAIARLLHDIGRCDINRRDEDDTTLLFRAVMQADVNCLKVLLDTDRAELYVYDKNGQTPFTVALDNSDWATLELLLRKQAPRDQNSSSTPTLWDLASHGGQSAVIKLLLELPGVVKSREELIQKHLFRAAKEGIECEMKILIDMEETDINAKNVRGGTPLLLAILNGHEKVVKLLLNSRRADLLTKDNYGYTPFLAAIQKDMRVVKAMVEVYNPSVEYPAPYAEQNPLILAVKFGKSEVTDVLLSSEFFDPNERDSTGRTPLMYAVQGRDMATIELLLSVPNIESEADDKDGRTALFWAVKYGEPRAVQLLLETNKVNINHKDRDGQTPIKWAERRNHIEIRQMLREREKAEADDVSGSKTPNRVTAE